MNLTETWRQPELAQALLDEVRELAARLPRPPTFMEVCGTHSHVIARSGLRVALDGALRLVSGPGCPVCVTSVGEIDAAIELARHPTTIVCTFGDMVRVPGSQSSLAAERAAGAEVQVIYSPMEAVEVAEERPAVRVAMIGVGFETTAPGVACAVRAAAEKGLANFGILCSHKLIPPALEALCSAGELALDGLICPGHVSTIIGSRAYEGLTRRYGIPCVVSGFETVDVLNALRLLLKQRLEGRAEVENAYQRAVRPEGNVRAQALMYEVFEPCDAEWRGLGTIASSGLTLRPVYAHLCAMAQAGIELQPGQGHPACHCGEVLRGAIAPQECSAFSTACTPDHPLGPCMVSSEGACAAEFKYGRGQVGLARAEVRGGCG